MITGEPLKWLLLAISMVISAFIILYTFVYKDDDDTVINGTIAMIFVIIFCACVEGANPSAFY